MHERTAEDAAPLRPLCGRVTSVFTLVRNAAESIFGNHIRHLRMPPPESIPPRSCLIVILAVHLSAAPLCSYDGEPRVEEEEKREGSCHGPR